ncbi:C-Jun-amino-terminal kinase-interacting protein 4 [Clarias gariepinus]|uniref:C-Jun-amino-terminal kinase-interacting protein 4 n=1 Tax=Clarias gariepinus TaxID=13013 RepID=UPI00234C270C|nr:C-Jun-amino-terminal kinase-interacting protein 4 [Clarias gariepinus]XP_053349932.1 C-Jun-amino-terminal kinase-interacting protein 4 [Clarias gariepinus]
MEYGEISMSGMGDLELDPDIVSEEAGKLYSELQSVVETHGADVVESLLPILVWVLEGLASCRSHLRESEEEVEKVKGEREELLERYERERTLRRESQERYLELDDQFEQERRAIRGRDKEREKRERDLEKKAREQADQMVALEEQRASLTRELSALKHTHGKLVLAYRDVVEKKKELEREGSPLRNHIRSKSSEPPEENDSVQHEETTEVASNPRISDTSASTDTKVIKTETINDSFFINNIISSTPELAQLQGLVEASTPLRAESEEPNCSLEDAIIPIKEEMGEEEKRSNQDDKKAEKEKDLDSLEWEIRNTDSVFSELSELSQEYVESVDHGVSVRDSTVQFEEILLQYEELKHTHEAVDAARKALISRVEELTNERSALNLELTSSQETINRLEGKTKEMEEETKRLRKELETLQTEESDATLSTSNRRFSRSEMARVVMEKNQYKERLIELQDALRRAQALGVAKNEKIPEDKKSSVWKRFNRFLGLTKDQLAPAALAPAALALTVPPRPSSLSSPVGSPHKLSVPVTQTGESLSPRLRRKELYREIRSHVWGNLGKRQVNGWSMPLYHMDTQNTEQLLEPKDVPVLTQLRLLDQRDASAKLTCAVAVPPEVSGEQTCSVWVITGPASSSDVTVIDPARSNTILDQFSLPPTSPALSICAVPPTGETSGTVWIGTQDGGVLVHSASGSRRRCLQSVSLSEGVHSLTFSLGQVIAGLSNGMLAFFSYGSGGWNLHSHEVLSLGITPLQPIRCCLSKNGCLWVGYWNKVLMIDVKNRNVEKSFTVSQRSEQQVRFLCAAGSGVWISCRLDPTLRLFDWATGRPLQEIDASPMITKALGNAFLSLSPLQISAMSVVSGRLWVGTGSGAVFSIPLSLSSESSIPYCSLASAQLCFHGHRQAVKFIISAPGCRGSSVTADGVASTSHLILSGGEGYINFRIGDEVSDGVGEIVPQRSERSHVIIWQSPPQSVPSSSL